MCGVALCSQIAIVFFTTLYLQASTFFGGCVFFGNIKLALIMYVVIINIATLIVFAVDKHLARKQHQQQLPIPLFTDYDAYNLESEGEQINTNIVYTFMHRKTRIGECVLSYLIFCGGVLGAWFGMFACWHKIKKRKFVIKTCFFTLINMCWPVVWLIATSDKTMSFCNNG